ncbi:MAG: type II restriction endonuclease, partial [Bacteroidetes bacterium]|nr:type II restriction endonuclease [Bacteroidota bacterium]
MRLECNSPSKVLNKAYARQSLKREQIETFKNGLLQMFNRIKEGESEEYHKNIVSDFLKDTWYRGNFEINTKGRKDLVIHTGKSVKDPVGVILEAKRPGNKSEMISRNKPNSKALHELISYYLHERYLGDNKEIKYLIITNIFEWYVFDAVDFEKFFFANPKFVKSYKDWHDGMLVGNTTDWFYEEVAEPFIARELDHLHCTYFNLNDYWTIISNDNRDDDQKLIDLYKVLSPEHLLKLPFANDSNSLNKDFYNELLHLIGLCELKEGSKKIISRLPAERREEGSLLENTMNILITDELLRNVPEKSKFGSTEEEQLFSIALELCITWLNRILFLKLLEGQLMRYHNGNKEYAFLNSRMVTDFDVLRELFFEVLAVETTKRNPSLSKKYEHVPYLNSSLFEQSDLERRTLRINQLKDHLSLPLFKNTVLKDAVEGNRLTGRKITLQYLFEFLDTYDFASESKAGIQEENKALINASVLGLIFEKINGYKDGSYFTPGFITMYMCRETIRRAVIQKFNDKYGWECTEFNEVYNKTDKISLSEANELINSLKICDPAVGSGHFLVSALNEIIAIKSDLGILADREGKLLKGWYAQVENDELILSNEDGIFGYNFKDRESQRVQEAIFHEKQFLIEHCLFGVDINPKSVHICRLRLWIELLKNAYYTHAPSSPSSPSSPPSPPSPLSPLSPLSLSSSLRHSVTPSLSPTLQTLPNIDINIKCGNSLISRFPLDASLKEALKHSKWGIDSYCIAVQTYREARDKEQKREIQRLIESIKADFRTDISTNDKRLLQLRRLNGELFQLTNQGSLFERTKKEMTDWNRQVKELTEKIRK